LEAKVNKIEEQIKEAGERRKTKLKKQINRIKEEYERRSEKLKRASKLIREAFEPKRDGNCVIPFRLPAMRLLKGVMLPLRTQSIATIAAKKTNRRAVGLTGR
jgi:hypothetical protein